MIDGLSSKERARIQDLLDLVPKNYGSVLDVGAREGHISEALTAHFPRVFALDLMTPTFRIPGVTALAADAVRLPFPDNSFDCIVCVEVIEHIPDVVGACRELARVARKELLVGVPYRQDLRFGRVTCAACGKPGPSWGHLHSFDEARLAALFPGMRVARRSYVESNRSVTNSLSAWLMDRAANPWGDYTQREPCVHCGAKLVRPETRTVAKRAASALAHLLNTVQQGLARPHPNWVHSVFSKD